MDSLKHILIVKTSALGDIIHTFPALTHLKAAFPEAEIDWVVENSFVELVASHPDVGNVFTIDSRSWRRSWWKKKTRQAMGAFRTSLRKKHYDLIIDFQGNTKSGLVCWCAKGERKVGFARQNVAEIPNLLFTIEKVGVPENRNIREDYLSLASYATGKEITSTEIAVNLNNEKPLPVSGYGCILICPGSRWINKQLTEKTLQDFLTEIHSRHQKRFLCLWGNEEERAIAERLQKSMGAPLKILPRLSLPQLQQLMSQVELVISMDSLPLHLAATTSVPTFSFFGPSSGDKYAPLGKNHGYFQGSCPYGKVFSKRCPILRSCKTGACLRKVDVEELLRCFEKFIKINSKTQQTEV